MGTDPQGGQVSADVAVVGGGIVGASVAYELAAGGASVAVIDASFTGRASDAGAGIVSPETFADPDEEWFEFGRRSSAHLRDLVRRIGSDGVELDEATFSECGSLVVALAEHEDRWFSEVATRATARSSQVTEIAPAEARGLFPALGGVWRALHSPTAGRVDGRRLCAGLRAAAERRGVHFVATEALSFESHGDCVDAVVGADSAVSCGTVVLAGGAWTARAARWVGASVPVTPTKGQIVHLKVRTADGSFAGVGGDTGRWPIVQPVLNFYVVPWPDGRVACGGTFEPDAGFDERPTAAGVRDLLREAVTIAPGLGDAELVEVRVGFRPESADDRPILGLLPGTSNVHVCTGHGANGLLMGPYSGALVARGVLGAAEAIATDAGGYGPARFAGVRPD